MGFLHRIFALCGSKVFIVICGGKLMKVEVQRNESSTFIHHISITPHLDLAQIYNVFPLIDIAIAIAAERLQIFTDFSIYFCFTMASPPHRSQTSYPPLSNPKKRPPLPLNSQAPPSKRRKHPSISNASTPGTSHPLRQTSFPPEEAAIDDARSVSVESDATGVTGGRSVVTAGTGAKGGRRGRKKKGEASVKSGARGAEGSVGGQGEEEEEDGDADDGLEDDGEEVDKDAEKKNLK